ncbi:MAG: hypothetical protein Q7L55_01760 [Actinomycetota bacterium]|nr:hypothetical protein [Actinomycetota bacterium]
MKPRLSLTLAASFSLLAIGAIGASTAATATPAGTTTVINCAGKGVVKPTSITITCADGGVSVNKITWSSWNPNEARGKGVLSWNTCLPQNCAAGIGVTYPVTIKLGGLAHAPKSLAFSKMTLGFPEGGPASLDTGTYILDSAAR